MNIHEEIQVLILKRLLGKISEKENEELDHWRNETEENELIFNWLSKQENHENEYLFRKSVDFKQAQEEMERKIMKEKTTTRSYLPIFRYAAAILLVILAGAGYWYAQYIKVTPPEIPEAVQLAMQQSIPTGKTEAIIEESGKWNSDLEDKYKDESVDLEKQNNDNSLSPQTTSQMLSSLTKDQLLAARRITTMHDKEYWVELDDGTLVHLNYNTRLIYPVKFGRSNRNVILEGEAYFMVAKDRSRPFIVHTPDGDVKVYGTEFNVNTRDYTDISHHSNTGTTVVLVKGAVSVTPTNGTEQMMKPGQQGKMLYTQCHIENVDVEPYVAWNIGRFVFENTTMSSLMEVLAHWYGKKIKFESEDLKNIHFTGTFDRYGKLDQMLEAIESVTDVKIINQGNTIVIRK